MRADLQKCNALEIDKIAAKEKKPNGLKLSRGPTGNKERERK